jgi:hypothetical protein
MEDMRDYVVQLSLVSLVLVFNLLGRTKDMSSILNKNTAVFVVIAIMVAEFSEEIGSPKRNMKENKQ